MNIDIMRRHISSHLDFHLKHSVPHHDIGDVYRYGVLPPGKLFRGLLVMALACDDGIEQEKIKDAHSDHALMASFVEIHHAYTLVHDDLPSMDDDDMRRGRPSLHKRFGQWKAVLVGDGLMGLGYYLLSFIESPQRGELLRFVSWATGPKGLIQGQVLDMAGEGRESFDVLKRLHILKTARLIQVALVGSTLLLKKRDDVLLREMFRLGHHLGLLFQFLDDLTELVSPLTSHEEAVNPWLIHPDKTFVEVERCFQQVQRCCASRPALQEVLASYAKSIHKICRSGESEIGQRVSPERVQSILDWLV